MAKSMENNYSTMIKLARLRTEVSALDDALDRLDDGLAQLMDDLAPPMWSDEDSDLFWNRLLDEAADDA